MNPSTYLIKDGRQTQSSYRHPSTKTSSSSSSSPVKNIPPKTLSLTQKTTDLHKPCVGFNDNVKDGYPNHRNNRTRNWCQNLDSTGSYPDSDYLSLGSNPNYSQGQITPFREQPYQYHPHNGSQSKLPNPHVGVMNPAYGNYYPTFRSNSTRDDDETTTTSGSYTINHDDIDDEIAATQYQVSQVV